MKTIVEYNVIRAKELDTLVRVVGIAIRDGFEPFGNMILQEGSNDRFLQPIVKYEGGGSWPPPPMA